MIDHELENYAAVEARLHQLWLECQLVARKPETLTEVESLINPPKSLPPKGGESEMR